MQKILNHKKQIKIHFLIKKRVCYGQAVYVVGSCNALGGWNVERALRLNWNHVLLSSIRTITGQGSSGWPYVNNSTYNSSTLCPLTTVHPQDGLSGNKASSIVRSQSLLNRIMYWYVPLCTIIENVWNANQICLNLLVPKYIVYSETEIYLAGGCNELGNWKSRLKLNKIEMSHLSEIQITKAK
jgi:hypothetical protein